MMYLVAFFTACACALIASGIVIFFTKYYVSHVRRESGRSAAHVSRLGGVAMIIAFVSAVFFHPNLVIDRSWIVLLSALGAVAVLGLWDDLTPLSWRAQLFAQVAIALFIFGLGVRIDYVSSPFGGIIQFASSDGFSWLSLIVGVVWIIAVMNTMNWLDGIDGLGGGVALIASGALFATALLPHVNQPPVAIAAAALAGATIGFLILNWFPAHIIAGTSGSFFWGLLIAILSIFAGAKIATALLVMIIPLVDAIWVIGERLYDGVNIFTPDKRHIHYKLLARGWAPWQVASLFIGIIGLVAFGAVRFNATGKGVVIGGIMLLTIASLVYLRKGHKKEAL